MTELPEGSRLLYQVLSGSHATGLATPTSDEDWRGVYQVPTKMLLGLRQPPETVEIPPDATYWELAHFARLCLKGNPNIMELLWIGQEWSTGVTRGEDGVHLVDLVDVTSSVVNEIRAIRTSFFTTTMIASYLGWVTKERRILGGYVISGDPNAKHLTGKRGSHLVRLLIGLNGALEKGVLPVRLEGDELALCAAIKRGEWTAYQVLSAIDSYKASCMAAAAEAHWPDPDPGPIEDIVLRARMEML
jgi:hypothetical protein